MALASAVAAVLTLYLVDARQEIDVVANNLSVKEVELADERAAHQETRDDRDSSLEALMEERSKLTETVGRLTQERDSLDESVANLSEQNGALRATVRSLSSDRDRLTSSDESLSNEVDGLTLANETLSNEIERLTLANETLSIATPTIGSRARERMSLPVTTATPEAQSASTGLARRVGEMRCVVVRPQRGKMQATV